MQVNRIMTRAVDCVSPRTTIEQVACMMRDRDIGALPVVRDGMVIGIITDRDIVVRAVAEDKMPMATRVAEIMTRDVHCCNEIDEIEEVIAQMGRAQVRRMPVMDTSGRLSGIVALADVALNEDEAATFALVEISEPSLVIDPTPVRQSAGVAS